MLYSPGGATPAPKPPSQPESQPEWVVPQWLLPGGCSGSASPPAPEKRYLPPPPTPVAWVLPALPLAHREAIASLGVGALDTLVLRFEEATWAESAHVWLTDPTYDALVTEWINLDALQGAPVLVGIVGPQGVSRLAALSDDEVIDRAMIELAPFFGAP